MIIATVYKRGGDFTREWVQALKRQLNRRMGGTYRAALADVEPGTWTFRVISDDPGLGAECIPIEHHWPGWWSKMELFRPGLWPSGEVVLAVDLDTLVVGDLMRFGSYGGTFAMLDDFTRPRRAQSGVMLLRDLDGETWKKWTWNPDQHISSHRGDGEWLDAHTTPDRIQSLYPGIVVSYKVHAREGPTPEAALVCGHGQPRFTDPSTGWAHEQWGAL